MAGRRVRDGRSRHRDRDHVLLRDFDTLLDCRRNFLGLARSEADAALTVADDHQGTETEVLAALDDFRHEVDVDDLIDHPALGSVVATIPAG